MKICSLILSLVFALSIQVYANLDIVATLPDLAAVAKEVGGEHVEVTVLAKPTEDPHYVDPRPSFVVKLNQADGLIEGGAELEQGWLPPLLEGSRNPKIQRGAAGLIVASKAVQLEGIPDSVSRAQGDIHALGNPHFMSDPVRAKAVAARIAEAFATLDPENAAAYRQNLQRFQGEIDSKMKEWQQALAPFKGKEIAAYHDSWLYFASRFGLKADLFLEPKPGIPPSPSHLAKVIEEIKARKIKAILVEPFHDRRVAESVAEKTGATVVDFAEYPGALPGTETYTGLMNELVSRLSKALGGAKD